MYLTYLGTYADCIAIIFISFLFFTLYFVIPYINVMAWIYIILYHSFLAKKLLCICCILSSSLQSNGNALVYSSSLMRLKSVQTLYASVLTSQIYCILHRLMHTQPCICVCACVYSSTVNLHVLL